jgi:hypothetical protein
MIKMTNEQVNIDEVLAELEVEKQESITNALAEVSAIVLGGQTKDEFYQSITTIREVLKSLR